MRQIVGTWALGKTSCESYRIAAGLEVRAGGYVKLLGKPLMGRDRDMFFKPCDLPELPSTPFSLDEALDNLEDWIGDTFYGMGMGPEEDSGDQIVKQAEQYAQRFGKRSRRRIARRLNTGGYRLYHDSENDYDTAALALFKGAAQMDSSYGRPRDNAARIHGKRGQVAECVTYLRQLKQMGRKQQKRLAHAKEDEAFKPVWGKVEFEALFGQDDAQRTVP